MKRELPRYHHPGFSYLQVPCHTILGCSKWNYYCKWRYHLRATKFLHPYPFLFWGWMALSYIWSSQSERLHSSNDTYCCFGIPRSTGVPIKSRSHGQTYVHADVSSVQMSWRVRLQLCCAIDWWLLADSGTFLILTLKLVLWNSQAQYLGLD
jgi:hypothetical protein